MNHTRKLVCLLLVLTLVLALSLTAFAAGETYTITIKDAPTGHIYEAYQIFAGDLHTEGEKKVLSNIKWGSGVSEAGQIALGDAAAAADLLHTEADAKAFAGKVSPYLTSPKTSTETNGTYTISGLEPGYYLVKDRDNSLSDSPDDFYTAYILEVVGDVTARPKGGKPTLDKQIKHNENGAWQMIFGVNTLPAYRQHGYAGELLRKAIADAKEQGRKGVVLTCKDRLVHYYASFGFADEGVTDKSTHGNVAWHQMRLTF